MPSWQSLSGELTSRFRDIDFILLFGSAARGEFRAGVSDVDMIIQVKKASTVPKLEGYAERLFWELDRKHDQAA
ncbi:TPA: nucleotidyltransferase domain-containing protein [Candidatus Micrarchaeota archaeon]|nr:nucleotidyltransferase domain-containing protein [Candidatus Micrarchaeota archaeon]